MILFFIFQLQYDLKTKMLVIQQAKNAKCGPSTWSASLQCFFLVALLVLSYFLSYPLPVLSHSEYCVIPALMFCQPNQNETTQFLLLSLTFFFVFPSLPIKANQLSAYPTEEERLRRTRRYAKVIRHVSSKW